ncbi:MAG: glutathione S-transferase family protein [Pseudomonadota bacterium]
MSDIILHHYPQSPVAEKVRAALGLKRASYASVEIPRIPPKPDLMPLTGGYRRTPVMQIGADIYCDSACICDELEQRLPEPSLHPAGNRGLTELLEQMISGEVFLNAVRIALGANLASLPPELAADRGRLYFGPDHDLAREAAQLPNVIAQTRATLASIDRQLADGGPFLFGELPGLADVLVHQIVWFIEGRYADGPALIAAFPALAAWWERFRSIGHGTAHDLSSTEALDIARDTKPATPAHVEENDPQALTLSGRVAIQPNGDGGDPPVKGAVQFASISRIAILRDDPRVGEICIHFPRAGYRVDVLDG